MLLEEFEQLNVLFRVSYHRVQKDFKDPMVVSAAILYKHLALPNTFLFKLDECIGTDPKLSIGLGEIGRAFEAPFRFGPGEAASQGRNHGMNNCSMLFLIRDMSCNRNRVTGFGILPSSFPYCSSDFSSFPSCASNSFSKRSTGEISDDAVGFTLVANSAAIS